MPTTTNYGWTTPADTDLVKDGAAAIRTLGTSVDTTTKALNPSTTLGDIEYRSSTANTNTRLGIGTTGQVLTVAGGVPSWATATSGGMTLISEQTATALTSLSFSSIPQTHKQLMLVWSGITHSSIGNFFTLRFNNVSTSSYSEIGMGWSNGVAGKYSLDGTSLAVTSYYPPFGRDASLTSLVGSAKGFILIDNYASTTKLKTYVQDSGFLTNASEICSTKSNGVFNSTSAITSLDIIRDGGSGTFSNITNTSIRLYGIS